MKQWVRFFLLGACLTQCAVVGYPLEYSDDFEGPSLNPFWTKCEQYGTIQLASDTAHTGTQAVKLVSTSGGQRYIQLISSYPVPMRGQVSVWFYDNNDGSKLYVQLDETTPALEGLDDSYHLSVGLHDWDGAYYHAGWAPPSQGRTTVPRTRGWHKFLIESRPTSISCSIDNQVVFSSNTADFTFNTIRLELTGPGSDPNAVAIFDDFYCNVYPSSSTPVVYPNPVTNLSATAFTDGTIRLNWQKSTSANTSLYHIYYDSGPINYAVIRSTVMHPGQSWLSPQLVSGTTYYFAVRTVDTGGNEETNTNLVSMMAYIPPPPPMIVVSTATLYGKPLEYADDFESSSINPFWMKREVYGTVQLASDTAHTGTQAVKLVSTSGGQRYIQLISSYPVPMRGQVSVWFYDNNDGSKLYVQLDETTPALEGLDDSYHLSVGLHDWDGAYYHAGWAPPSQGRTTVPRTRGWHKFLIESRPTSISCSIDNQVVFSSNTADFTFNTIRLELTGPSFDPNAVAIFDDFYCNVYPSSSTYANPVTNLSATALSDVTIRLNWQKSVSPRASLYHIYYDSGPINYAVIRSTVMHPGQSWLSPQLVSGTTYCFAARTVDTGGNEETNTNLVSMMAYRANQVRAAIKIPEDGKKVSGNRLMVMADPVSCTPADIKQVWFEYRKAGDELWTVITPATANQPNPDTQAPFFVHWDVSALDEGAYQLRAIAVDMKNVEDDAPGYVTAFVDNGNPDIQEKDNGKGEHERTQVIDGENANHVYAGETGKDAVTEVYIPKGSIDAKTAKVSLVINAQSQVPPPERTFTLDAYRTVTLEGANLVGSAWMTLSYRDDDSDDIVDGSQVPVAIQSVFVYEPTSGGWRRLATDIDKRNKSLTCRTTSLALFGVFGAPASDFSAARAYPNPFRPGKGHIAITFDNLTMNSRLQIMTLAGEMVWEQEGIMTGTCVWNAVNQAGRDVASGVYLCRITNDRGEKKVLKVAVIR